MSAVAFAIEEIRAGRLKLTYTEAEIKSFVRQAVLLHDTLEDHKDTVSPEKLLAWRVHPVVVRIVQNMTREEETPYFEEILRIAQCPLTTICKRGDLCHNTRIERTTALVALRPIEKIMAHQRRYLLSYLFLSKALPEADYVRLMDGK